jgi:tRNA U34 5-methylaminomethyl-2-thiouridine-forming methyltransferase MnmC
VNLQAVITGDGSSTVLDPITGEHYHSTFGAITESSHVFITNGFKKLSPDTDPVNILEVGFGTGLNALLTLTLSEELGRSVRYHALEPFPLDAKTAGLLNYPLRLGRPETAAWFTGLHAAAEGVITHITDRFTLLKTRTKLEDAALPEKNYPLIYLDAFSPNVQPELWQNECFAKMFLAIQMGGMLTTYCSKGAVSRAMKESGFQVEKLPGPPGKRHILRGTRISS